MHALEPQSKPVNVNAVGLAVDMIAEALSLWTEGWVALEDPWKKHGIRHTGGKMRVGTTLY